MANLNQLDLVDVWRELNPDKMEFTWRRLHPTAVFVRLDYIFFSTSLLQFTKCSEIIPGIKTDHSAVTAELQFDTARKGPGY